MGEPSSLSLPVLAAAVFFSAMHLMLLTMHVDLVTVLVIVLVALLLGLLAGYYRERSGSLIPAIVAHTLANLTGTILAILWKAQA